MRLWLLTAALAMALSAPAICPPARADKITVDPNAASVARVAEPDDQGGDTLDKDKRLDKKITISAGAKPATSVLDTLGQLADVDMKAGQNEKDWLSRERKMTVFAKDIPLRDLMRSMARVMKYKWRVTGGAPDAPRYRFYLDRKAAADAEIERAKQREREEKRKAEQRSRAVDSISKLAKASPDEIAALKDSNPFLYTLSETGVAAALDGLMAQCPSAAEAFRAGTELTMSAADLPTSGQDAMARAFTSLRRVESMFDTSDADWQRTDDLRDLSKLTLRFRPLQERSDSPERLLFLGEMSISGEAGHASFPLIDPEGETAKLIGKALKLISENGARPQDLEKMLEAEMLQVVNSVSAKSEVGDPTVSHPDDPELERKVKVVSDSHDLPQMLRSFADVSSFCVVSDSFGRTRLNVPRASLTGKEITIREFLDGLTGSALYNWWRSGQIIELRARNWYDKQSLMIPQEWLDGWRKTLEKTGKLGLDDLAQMAKLSREQLLENMATDSPDEVFAQAGLPWCLESGRAFLTFYGALNREQIAQIYTSDGLDMRSLSTEQWELAVKMLSGQHPSLLRDQPAPLRLKSIRSIGDADRKPVQYQFTVTSGQEEDGASMAVLYVPIPRYERPEQQPQTGNPTPNRPAGPKGGTK